MPKPKSDSPPGKARLAKEQALAKLRILQSAALEGSLLPVGPTALITGQNSSACLNEVDNGTKLFFFAVLGFVSFPPSVARILNEAGGKK